MSHASQQSRSQTQQFQEACMNEQGGPDQTQIQIGYLERVEARTGNLQGIQRHCQEDGNRKA